MEQLILFLPAYYANMCPGFAHGWKWPGDVPISKQWLGRNKTWRGHYASLAGGIVMSGILYLVSLIFPINTTMALYKEHWLALGLLMGIGAKIGDDAKSFIKRRLGRNPGSRWWPFDQVDYIIGAIIFSMPITGWLGLHKYLIIVLPTLLLHGICAERAYMRGQKNEPF